MGTHEQEAIIAIQQERLRQAMKYGEAHDVQHEPTEWLALIMKQLGQAASAVFGGSSDDYEHQLVQAGALIVAAIEAHRENVGWS